MNAMRKAKPDRRYVYGRIRLLVDPTTGESVKAFTIEHPTDRRLVNAKKFKVGQDVRLTVAQPRNVGYHRKVHALGSYLLDHVDGYESCADSHDAVKRLQRESGVCCEEQEIDLGPLGRVPVKVPESLAFDAMTQDRFDALYTGLLRWACDHYRPDMSAEQFEGLLAFGDNA